MQVAGIVGILLFIGLMTFLGRKTKNAVLDEREMLLRLKVNSFISKSVEYTLIVTPLIYLFAYKLVGLSVILIVGLAGIFSQAFANFYFRREEK